MPVAGGDSIGLALTGSNVLSGIQDSSSRKHLCRFVNQAARLQVCRNEMPHRIREVIFQAQLKKDRLGGKSITAVADYIFRKPETFAPDCLNGPAVEK